LLSYYATKFKTVEIDSTYYGTPRASTVRKWYERTPPDVKALMQLNGVDRDTADARFGTSWSLPWDIVTDKLNKALEDIVMKSVSAFANTKGWVLLIGVNDGGQILGLNKDYASMDGGNRDKFGRHLRQLARDKFGVSYTSSQLNCNFNEVKGLEVCNITVRPAPHPLVMKVVHKNGQATERLYV
jgi:hypothetical protein